MNSNFAQVLSKELKQGVSCMSPGFAAVDIEGDIEDIVRIQTILHFNCVEAAYVKADGSGKDAKHVHRVGLYPVACKAAHSCAPNADWYTQDDCGSKVMRSLMPIKEGEEVTVSYLSAEQMLLPKEKRQKHLLDQKEFLCRCPRCAPDIDDTRTFQCSQLGCSGKCFLEGHLVGCCNTCFATLTETAQVSALAHESAIGEKVDYIDYVLDSGQAIDITDLLLSLKLEPLHVSHGLACRHAFAQHELFVQVGDLARAAEAFQRHVSAWQVIPCSRGAAFAFEKLGVHFIRAGDMVSASKHLATAYELLSLNYQIDHPYVLCVARELAKARIGTACSKANNHMLSAGCMVLLRGLQRSELNGCIGHCGEDQQHRRVVELQDERRILVRPENLKVLPQTELQSGDLIVVYGLSSAVGRVLNGSVGTLVNRAENRWAVQVEGQGVKSIQSKNIAGIASLICEEC